jgi:Protein of unknown function (DUF3144)
MPTDKNDDDDFYERADAHIHLSNDQAKDVDRGKVSASMLYGAARFNAWVTARGFDDAAGMRAAKEETLKYFVAQYTKMLEENLDDYMENFDGYMKASH